MIDNLKKQLHMLEEQVQDSSEFTKTGSFSD